MKQLKKMSARGTISCDVTKKLIKRSKVSQNQTRDLELYNKEGTTDASIPPKKRKGSELLSRKMEKSIEEWNSQEIGYLEMSQEQEVQGIFLSNHNNDINCYEYSDKISKEKKQIKIRQKKRDKKGSWKDFNDLKSRKFASKKIPWHPKENSSKKLGGLRWDEREDPNTDSSRDQVNLVYRQKKKPSQRSSRIVDIYKEKSRALYEPKKPVFHSKKKAGGPGRSDIFAQFDEIQAKYNIDLMKSKQIKTGRKKIRNASPSLNVQTENRKPRKQIRLKPSKQLKLEGLITDEPVVEIQGNLSQYQSLNYSVDPMMKKQRKKSVSQKKFKDYSEQIKKEDYLERNHYMLEIKVQQL